jgi:electron transfer flavoprotein alpha subunit
MTTLLIAEHEHATLKDSTNKALTAAAQLGAEVHVLVAGSGEASKRFCSPKAMPMPMISPNRWRP